MPMMLALARNHRSLYIYMYVCVCICVLCGASGKNLPIRDAVQSLGQEDPLEKEMATHFSIFAREIPWTEEPGSLQPKSDTA